MWKAGISCALLCAAMCRATAFAQDLSEHEFLTEFPTVLSASRLQQHASETPQAVTVIDQAMIRASGAREFAELFRLVPGFTVTYVTYLKGYQPLVTYHGLGREFFSRLQVLIDGRSINNATLGGMDWSEFAITPDDIDRIEVIRGPSNATHGIGAFLATINFITKHSLQQRGAVVAAGAGSDGIRDLALRLGGGSDGFDYRVLAGRRADDGFDDVADGRDRDFASGRADWRISPSDELMLQLGATDGDNDISRGGPNDPERSASVSTGYAQAKWDRTIGPHNAFYVQLYHYYFDLDDRFVPEPTLPGVTPLPVDAGTTVRRTDIEVQQNLNLGTDLRWVWGGSWREDRTDAPLLLDEVGRLRIARLFGHVEWRATDTVLLNAGAMVEDNNLTGTDVAPQLALNYQLAAHQTVRFGLSRALRTPTVIEKQGQFAVGPPGTPREGPAGDLFPEEILSREISYLGEWPERHVTLELKAFVDDVDELIGLVGVRTGAAAEAFPQNAVNFDDARQYGIEGQWTWRPTADDFLMASAAWLEIDSDDGLDHYSRSAPDSMAHLLWSHRFADVWDVSAGVHAQSGYWPGGNSDPQGGFARVDSRVGRRFMSSYGEWEFAVALENAFDNQYAAYRSDEIAGRRIWFTLRYGSLR